MAACAESPIHHPLLAAVISHLGDGGVQTSTLASFSDCPELFTAARVPLREALTE